MRYAVHSVHDARANEAFASREEEERCNVDVGAGRNMKVDMLGVQVKGHAEDEDEAEQVGPDVCGLVVDACNGADARPVSLAETVPVQNVWVDLPGLWKVFVAYQ